MYVGTGVLDKGEQSTQPNPQYEVEKLLQQTVNVIKWLHKLLIDLFHIQML